MLKQLFVLVGLLVVFSAAEESDHHFLQSMIKFGIDKKWAQMISGIEEKHEKDKALLEKKYNDELAAVDKSIPPEQYKHMMDWYRHG
ncbi:8 kDa glycoprotein [Caenorhabditis elegans]|uniref:8 kDa glycoprotein n=1 Tax=Caenorhabditis elegans TaxID=6239 RepID=O44142_CAEEL|nr:8 kDa glycoprotein [Caenorhabditis elegans]CCD67233.2 8 kDa glycoprotein [Caenorhabditis elegans]|eukprot:NP_500038.4 Uncharacterized protein CELE_C44B12.3 [Caenorhabditis elegans]